jgi:uncharacterized protein YvpB
MSRGKRAVLALFLACDVALVAGLGVLINRVGLPGWPAGAWAGPVESPARSIVAPAAGSVIPEAHPATDPPSVGTSPTTRATPALLPANNAVLANSTATPGSSAAGTEAVAGQAAGRPAPPKSAYITRVAGHAQALALSCESRSAADWAAAYGFHIDELDFLSSLPSSDDPDRGFVGDVNGAWGLVPPSAYGVHAGPVARLLSHYGVPAHFQLFMRFETLQAEVAGGRPVIVWVTGHVEAGAGRLYIASDGHHTVIAPFEHTVIVIGYDPTTVTVLDGARRYSRTIEQFMASWQPLRYMAITAGP